MSIQPANAFALTDQDIADWADRFERGDVRTFIRTQKVTRPELLGLMADVAVDQAIADAATTAADPGLWPRVEQELGDLWRRPPQRPPFKHTMLALMAQAAAGRST